MLLEMIDKKVLKSKYAKKTFPLNGTSLITFGPHFSD